MEIGGDIISEWIIHSLKWFELHLYDHGCKEPLNRGAEYIAIQCWAASSSRNSEGYLELKTPDQLFSLVCLDHKSEALIGQRISSYRTPAAAHIYKVQEEDGEELLGVPGRVFKSKRVEESPNIHHYNANENPLKDFALNCGIKASLCLPLFLTDGFSGDPDGVVEILFTSNSAFNFFKRVIYDKYCSDTNIISTPLILSERIRICRYNAFLNDATGAYEEIKHVLIAVCQTHCLPFAQSWFILTDGFRCSLVMDHASSLDLTEAIHWYEFKEASSTFCSYLGDGLVSKTFQSHKSCFCKDITELSITNYPLVHYVRNCSSIACVTIYLQSFTQQYNDCVLEFFVPYVKVNIRYPQIFLSSLLATLKDYLRVYTVGFGEQDLFVQVINSSMHNETDYLKVCPPVVYLPHHEGPQKEKGAVPQHPLSKQPMVEHDEQEDENVPDIEGNCSTITDIPGTREESFVEDVGGTYNEETVVFDPSNQKLRSQDSMQHKVLIVGAEKDETKKEKKSEIDISFESISKHFGTPLNDAAKSFVSRSTFKRICRGYDIKRWKPGKKRVGGHISSRLRKINTDETSKRNFSTTSILCEQDTLIAVHTQQDVNEMTVKATYEGDTIMFDLLNSSGLTDLEDNVIERLHLERKKFTTKFQDDDGDWILIACDKDVHKCMRISRTSKKTTIKMLINRPIHHRAP